MDGLMERGGAGAEAGSRVYRDYRRRCRTPSSCASSSRAASKLEWAMTRIVSDDPGKVLDKAPPAASLPEQDAAS